MCDIFVVCFFIVVTWAQSTDWGPTLIFRFDFKSIEVAESILMCDRIFCTFLVRFTPCKAGWGRPLSPFAFTFRYFILLFVKEAILSWFSWNTVILVRIYWLYSCFVGGLLCIAVRGSSMSYFCARFLMCLDQVWLFLLLFSKGIGLFHISLCLGCSKC